jgi:transaldolase
MNRTTQKLHEIGQSLWLDNITHRLARQRYASELYSGAIDHWSHLEPNDLRSRHQEQHDYDDAIRRKMDDGKSGEALFFELAIEDLRQAADLFRPIYDRTDGVDGWVSLEVSPLLAQHDRYSRRSQGSPQPRGAAQSLHQDSRYQRGASSH